MGGLITGGAACLGGESETGMTSGAVFAFCLVLLLERVSLFSRRHFLLLVVLHLLYFLLPVFALSVLQVP